MDESESCRICLDDKNIKNITFPCDCKVFLHIRCLRDWLTLREETCPNCMKLFRSKKETSSNQNINFIYSPKGFIEKNIRQNIDSILSQGGDSLSEYEEEEYVNNNNYNYHRQSIERWNRYTLSGICILFFILLFIACIQRILQV